MSDLRKDMDLLVFAKKDQESRERIVMEMRQQVTELAPYKEQVFQLKANNVILEEKMKFRDDENKRLQHAVTTLKQQHSHEMELAQQRIAGLEERLAALQGQMQKLSEDRDRASFQSQKLSSDHLSELRQLGIEKQQLQDSLNTVRNQLQQRESLQAELHRKHTESALEVQRLEQLVEKMSRDMQEYRTLLQRSTEEISTLRQAKDKTSNDLLDAIHARETAEHQVSVMRKEVDRIPQLLEHIDMEKQMRLQEFTAKDSALREVQIKYSSAQRTAEEVPGLVRRVEEANQRADHNQHAVVTLQKQLEDSVLALKEAMHSKEDCLLEVVQACLSMTRSGGIPMSPRSQSAPASRTFRTALQLVRSTIQDLTSEVMSQKETIAALQHAETQRKMLVQEKESLVRKLEEERLGNQRSTAALNATSVSLASKEHDTQRLHAELSQKLADMFLIFQGYGSSTPPRNMDHSLQHVSPRARGSILPEQLDSLSSRIRLLIATKEASDRRVQQLEASLDESQRAHAEARSQLAQSWAQARDTQLNLEQQMQRDLASQRERLSSEYESQVESIIASMREVENDCASLRSDNFDLRTKNDELLIDLSQEREKMLARSALADQYRKQLDVCERDISELRRTMDLELQRATDQAEKYRNEIVGLSSAKEEQHSRILHLVGTQEGLRRELEEERLKNRTLFSEFEKSQMLQDAMWKALGSVAQCYGILYTNHKCLRLAYRNMSRIHAFTDASLKHTQGVISDALSLRPLSPRRRVKRRPLRVYVIMVLAALRWCRLRSQTQHEAITRFSSPPARDVVLAFHGGPSEITSDVNRVFGGAEPCFRFDMLNRIAQGLKGSVMRTKDDTLSTVVGEIMNLKHLAAEYESVALERESTLRKLESENTALLLRLGAVDDNNKTLVRELQETKEEVQRLRTERSHDMAKAQQDIVRRAIESEELQRQIRETLYVVGGNNHAGSSVVINSGIASNPTVSPRRAAASSHNTKHNNISIDIPKSQPGSPARNPTTGATRTTIATSPTRRVGQHVNTSTMSHTGVSMNDLTADEVLLYIRQLDDRVTHALHYPH